MKMMMITKFLINIYINIHIHIYKIMTFLVAGHETSSAATSWALHYLSTNQEVQNTLREELNK